MSNTVTYSSCVTFAFTYDGFGRVFRTDHYPLTTGHDSYVWGNDLSGTPQGAGGVGGLLAVIPGAQGFRPAYYPCYDANGNVTEYVDGNGVTAAHYAYDAYGNTTVKSGPMADDFNFRFSTKYFDAETGNYYYIKRHYSPFYRAFISEDPIGISGGLNLYGFCANDPINKWDYLGMTTVVAKIWWETYNRECFFFKGIWKFGDPAYASVRKKYGSGTIAKINKCDFFLVFVQVDKPDNFKGILNPPFLPLVSSKDNGVNASQDNYNAVPHSAITIGTQTYTKLWERLKGQTALNHLANPIFLVHTGGWLTGDFEQYGTNVDTLYIHQVNKANLDKTTEVTVWVDKLSPDEKTVTPGLSKTIRIQVEKGK